MGILKNIKCLQYIFFVIFIFCTINLYGQSITWQRTYDGPFQFTDVSEDICSDENGNYFIIGTTQRKNSYSSIFVLKINDYGDTLWTRFIDTAYGKAIVSSGDGGCVFTGFKNSAFTGKYDSNGNLVWFKNYTNNIIFSGLDIIQTNDKGFMLCGAAFYDSAIVVKTNFKGDIEWLKIYSAGHRKCFRKLITSIDNGIILIGYQNNTQTDTTKSLITKIDLVGNIINERIILMNGSSGLYDIDILFNEYLFCGQIYDFINFRVFIMKMDLNLNDKFTKIFISDDDESTPRIKAINNNKYVMSMARLTNTFPFRYYSKIITTDSLGTVLNQKFYNGFGDLFILSILPLINGDILYTGYAEFQPFPVKEDVYALRTDSLLNAPPPISIINQSIKIPNNYMLYQNFPNPFNPTTSIKYDIPQNANITIKVYDILGKEVFNLIEYKRAGSYEVKFEGSSLASGMYFYSLEANGYKDVKKMVLVK